MLVIYYSTVSTVRCFAGQPGQLTPPTQFCSPLLGSPRGGIETGPADPTTTWPVPTTVHLLRSSSMPVHACNAMRCVAMRASCQWSYRIANCCCVSLQILKTRQLTCFRLPCSGSFFLTADLSCMAWRGPCLARWTTDFVPPPLRVSEACLGPRFSKAETLDSCKSHSSSVSDGDAKLAMPCGIQRLETVACTC